MTNSDWIQLSVGIVLSLTLVAVLWYAWETRKMAKATHAQAEAARQQADATQAQADVTLATLNEVRKQRLDSFKPRLIIRHIGGSLGTSFFERVEFSFVNEGNGPALNIRFQVIHPAVQFNDGRLYPTALVKGASGRWQIETTAGQEDHGDLSPEPNPPAQLEAHYEDIEGNHYKSSLEESWDLKPGRQQVAIPCDEHTER